MERPLLLSKLPPHDHNYTGPNYVAVVGRGFVGHDYVGHDYIGEAVFVSQLRRRSPRYACVQTNAMELARK